MTVNLWYFSLTLKWSISGLLNPDIFFQEMHCRSMVVRYCCLC